MNIHNIRIQSCFINDLMYNYINIIQYSSLLDVKYI